MIPNIPSVFNRTQPATSPASQINDAAADGAAKRKVIAAEQLKVLRERLRVLMLIPSNGNGTAASAAQVATEVAAAVKNYAAVSGTQSNASSTTEVSKQDTEFLSTATQLSAQVKSILTAEARKTKARHSPEERYQREVNQMDAAIADATKSLKHDSLAMPIAASPTGFHALA